MLVSVVVPTFNEAENVEPLAREIIALFENELRRHDLELIFIDNASSDGTRDALRALCAGDRRIKAIFNSKNVGPFNSQFYGLCQAGGDCAVSIFADFQEPPELIADFVREWENGSRIVCGIKSSSQESRLMYLLRSVYYKLMRYMSDFEQIEHFTGFGLYDRSFLDVMRGLDDAAPFLRGIVAELGSGRRDIVYRQRERRAGRSAFNLYRYYDAAMLGFTSYTKLGLRVAAFGGAAAGFLSAIALAGCAVVKLYHGEAVTLGLLPLLLALFFFDAVILFFIGFLGEYVLHVNTKVTRRPLVLEEERINFGAGGGRVSAPDFIQGEDAV